jgi:5-methylcytosine-specific restriction endonuclease McrA
MIQLTDRPDKPDRLRSRAVAGKKASLTRKHRNGTPFTQADFDRNYFSHLDIRRPLWRWQEKKCCYCERRRDLKLEPDVEHFRPKAEVTGQAGPGYWWLTYEWSNLFFSCKTCNQRHKKNEFPLEPGGVRAQPGDLALLNERPTLADVGNENPEPLIGYVWRTEPEPLAKPVGLDAAGRGARIVKILGLDRDDLNQERGALIDSLEGWVEAFHQALHNSPAAQQRVAAHIRRNTARGQTFLGFRRFFFTQWHLQQYLAP